MRSTNLIQLCRLRLSLQSWNLKKLVIFRRQSMKPVIQSSLMTQKNLKLEMRPSLIKVNCSSRLERRNELLYLKNSPIKQSLKHYLNYNSILLSFQRHSILIMQGQQTDRYSSCHLRKFVLKDLISGRPGQLFFNLQVS